MNNPFPKLTHSPSTHYRISFYAAVSRVLGSVGSLFGSPGAAFERFPFLAGYHAQLAEAGLADTPPGGLAAWWGDALRAWEATSPPGLHLPLRALREATGLGHEAVVLLLAVGLVEEDPRFGEPLEVLQGLPGQRRPALGSLQGWWPADDADAARADLRRLMELGLLQAQNPDAARSEQSLHVSAPLWEALRGGRPAAPAAWLRHYEAGELCRPDDLILPDSVRRPLAALPALVESGEVRAVVVRGPRHNGRRSLLGALARSLGMGRLDFGKPAGPGADDRWHTLGPLATLLHALPVVAFDLAPGETAAVPMPSGYDGPIGVVLGRQGGLSGPGVERAVVLTLDIPGPDERLGHWAAGFGGGEVEGIDTVAERFRMTAGNIRRAARLARSHARLDGRGAVSPVDVREAGRSLNRQALDTLAARVETSGVWGDLAVPDETARELAGLEARCRHRERLARAVGPALGTQLNCGVRALFSGPSGTGKTMAARLLAASLQTDLYRLDLATVVNKYIGETEKNLSQVFDAAEELDVILLLDEGDALLTQRTGVQSSNDRYANLETNYLLQRLERFEGILVITTNAGDRIDSAFKRRIDVVVEFPPPDAAERWAIWRSHLPASHGVDPQRLGEIASRCSLTGGQIRNAVLDAARRALDEDAPVATGHLEEALRREYRKLGAVCPLRVAANPDAPRLANGHAW